MICEAFLLGHPICYSIFIADLMLRTPFLIGWGKDVGHCSGKRQQIGDLSFLVCLSPPRSSSWFMHLLAEWGCSPGATSLSIPSPPWARHEECEQVSLACTYSYSRFFHLAWWKWPLGQVLLCCCAKWGGCSSLSTVNICLYALWQPPFLFFCQSFFFLLCPPPCQTVIDFLSQYFRFPAKVSSFKKTALIILSYLRFLFSWHNYQFVMPLHLRHSIIEWCDTTSCGLFFGWKKPATNQSACRPGCRLTLTCRAAEVGSDWKRVYLLVSLEWTWPEVWVCALISSAVGGPHGILHGSLMSVLCSAVILGR